MAKQSVVKLTNGRFNVDCKSLSSDQSQWLNDLAFENGITSKSALLQKAIEVAMSSQQTNGAGAKDKTLDKIGFVVHKQIEINQNSTAIISVGTGDNQRQIRYEQRSITNKWIMENVKPSPRFESVQQWLSVNADEINAHNEWLVESNAYVPTLKGVETPSLEQRIENFNRSASKNHKKADENAWNNWDNMLNCDDNND